MNKLVLYIVFLQAFLCLFIALIGSFWYRENAENKDYIPKSWNVPLNGLINYFSYFLLLNTLLPISLIVTLEIVKVVQSLFIMVDARMYSLERD